MEYCLDTSGISNPLENMPEDIHVTLWGKVMDILSSGRVFVNTEIYDELILIDGSIGNQINGLEDTIKLEIGVGDWDWTSYLENFNRLKETYEPFISEYNDNRKQTVGLNDISIIALAKTLNLPLITMEKETINIDPTSKKRRIPDICRLESVQVFTFSEFLREENISY